jgi:hypothetical protein
VVSWVGKPFPRYPLVSHQTENQSSCLQAQTLLCVCIILVWALDMFFTQNWHILRVNLASSVMSHTMVIPNAATAQLFCMCHVICDQQFKVLSCLHTLLWYLWYCTAFPQHDFP